MQGDTVASSSCDSSVMVWSVKFKSWFSHSAIKTLPDLITKDVSTFCCLKFSKYGEEWAIPAKKQLCSVGLEGQLGEG